MSGPPPSWTNPFEKLGSMSGRGDAGVSMLPLHHGGCTVKHLKARTYMFFFHGTALSDDYHPYPTEFTNIDYFAPKYACPDTSHAEMLHGFKSKKQMMDNMSLFMHGSEHCAADGTIAMLHPILFSSSATIDVNTPHIGLFRYDFLGNDEEGICDVRMTRLKTHDDFDHAKFYTYSDLFQMVSADIKLKLKTGQAINPDKLHIIFFCCRQRSTPIPPLQITPLPPGVIISSPTSIDASLQLLPNIQLLEYSMAAGPPRTSVPLGAHQGMKHMTHQSCLLNLFAFYGIIPYDQANVIASMLGAQQRTNLKSNQIVVAGESVRYFLNVMDGVLLPREIERRYIVERMSARDGLQKIWDNLRAVIGQSRTHHAWFIKLYPTELKPGTTDTLSEMGHWVSFWITPTGEMHFVDPQGLPLLGAGSTSFGMANTGPAVDSQPVMAYLIANYRTADIVYALTPNPPNPSPPNARYLTGILYRRDQLGPARRLPKGGRKNWSRKRNATANAKTRCKKRT
jgi:hypothetical protein